MGLEILEALRQTMNNDESGFSNPRQVSYLPKPVGFACDIEMPCIA